MLGSIPPGQRAEGTLTLLNPHGEALTVDRVETSCPCVLVSPLPLGVDAGQSATLSVVFDASHDPAFRGALAIELVGRASEGSALFRSHISLTVAAAPKVAKSPFAGSYR